MTRSRFSAGFGVIFVSILALSANACGDDDPATPAPGEGKSGASGKGGAAGSAAGASGNGGSDAGSGGTGGSNAGAGGSDAGAAGASAGSAGASAGSAGASAGSAGASAGSAGASAGSAGASAGSGGAAAGSAGSGGGLTCAAEKICYTNDTCGATELCKSTQGSLAACCVTGTRGVLTPGTACTTSESCASGVCLDDKCAQACEKDPNSCPADQQCNMVVGVCRPKNP